MQVRVRVRDTTATAFTAAVRRESYTSASYAVVIINIVKCYARDRVGRGLLEREGGVLGGRPCYGVVAANGR